MPLLNSLYGPGAQTGNPWASNMGAFAPQQKTTMAAPTLGGLNPSLTGGTVAQPKTSIAGPSYAGLTGGSYQVPSNPASVAAPTYDMGAPQTAGGGNAAGTGQAPGFQSQYATWDNIQPYMNPYVDQVINSGTNAIEHSAASKGLFGSSGNINDIGNWATNTKAKAYNDAVGMFTDDRNYMTDNYWKDRISNDSNFWNTYNANWGQYTTGLNDFTSRMLQSYLQNNGIVGTGINATDNVGGIYSMLGRSLAELFGNRGEIGMQGAVNSGNNTNSMIDGLIGLLPMLAQMGA